MLLASEDIKQKQNEERFLYHVLKSAGQPHLLPRVYMLKSVLLFPLEDHVLKSAGQPQTLESTCWKVCCSSLRGLGAEKC